MTYYLLFLKIFEIDKATANPSYSRIVLNRQETLLFFLQGLISSLGNYEIM
jgi:hypothetical protein